tara:strand:+ start:37 stop:870 length:834 start_codon:yes stop_codon:yes gene_type:complete
MASATSLRVAVAGLGAVGLPVATALARGGLPGLRLAAVSASDLARAATRLQQIDHPAAYVPIVPADKLHEHADVVLEALPPAQFMEVAVPTLTAGKTLVALSVTQVLENPHCETLAAEHGGRILIPSGALCGLDAVRAAAEGGNVRSVTMRTRKPPRSLQNAPMVAQKGIDLSQLSEAVCLYEGSVREAAKLFPANVNVAVALALAGIGPDRTTYEVWADPGIERNTHVVIVESDESNFRIEVAGVPTASNPATGALTPLSALATLRGLVSTMKVGT